MLIRRVSSFLAAYVLVYATSADTSFVASGCCGCRAADVPRRRAGQGSRAVVDPHIHRPMLGPVHQVVHRLQLRQGRGGLPEQLRRTVSTSSPFRSFTGRHYGPLTNVANIVHPLDLVHSSSASCTRSFLDTSLFIVSNRGYASHATSPSRTGLLILDLVHLDLLAHRSTSCRNSEDRCRDRYAFCACNSRIFQKSTPPLATMMPSTFTLCGVVSTSKGYSAS